SADGAEPRPFTALADTAQATQELVDREGRQMVESAHVEVVEMRTAHREELGRRAVSSVRGVMQAITSRAAKPRAYTTFMTIMARLDSKGLLERTREGKTDFYRATHTPARYSDLRAQADVDSLVDQFGELALGHFARQMAQLNPQRRRALERLAREKGHRAAPRRSPAHVRVAGCPRRGRHVHSGCGGGERARVFAPCADGCPRRRDRRP